MSLVYAFRDGRRRGVDVEMSMWFIPSLAARLFRPSGSIWTDRSESSRPDFELHSASSTMRLKGSHTTANKGCMEQILQSDSDW